MFCLQVLPKIVVNFIKKNIFHFISFHFLNMFLIPAMYKEPSCLKFKWKEKKEKNEDWLNIRVRKRRKKNDRRKTVISITAHIKKCYGAIPFFPKLRHPGKPSNSAALLHGSTMPARNNLLGIALFSIHI